MKYLKLSQTKETEAKRLKVEVEDLVMADLMCIGYSKEDAFKIAFYPKVLAMSDDALSKESSQKIHEDAFTRAYATRKEVHRQDGIDVYSDADDDLLDKRTTAKLILKTALKLPIDSKERIEGLMKYSELMRYKNDDVEGSVTDNIHFFLPMKCSQCPLLKAYNDNKRSNGEDAVRPDEMGHIIKNGEKKSAEA